MDRLGAGGGRLPHDDPGVGLRPRHATSSTSWTAASARPPLVVAVLSRNYLSSRYGRMEWQAALRADPDNPSNKLVTIRLEDCPARRAAVHDHLGGPGGRDRSRARQGAAARPGQAGAGRAGPSPRRAPAFPTGSDLPAATADAAAPAAAADAHPPQSGERAEVPARRRRRTPGATRSACCTWPGPGSGGGCRTRASRSRRRGHPGPDLGRPDRLYDRGTPRPDLMVVTGDLTESGSLREFGRGRRVPHRPAAAARAGAAPAGDRAGPARRHQGRVPAPTSPPARPTTSARSRRTGPSGGISPACSTSSIRGSTAGCSTARSRGRCSRCPT